MFDGNDQLLYNPFLSGKRNMEIGNMEKIGDWQGRCYRCVEEGIICQDPSLFEIPGSWIIPLGNDKEAKLDKTRFRIDKCPLKFDQPKEKAV